MLNGLDLFSGIGGMSKALGEWVKPIAYCEIDSYCRGVLLSRMARECIWEAPIWDDVRTLEGKQFQGCIDIIYGGFPCQDISIAGRGKGLEGERSGLFFEIMRISKKVKPLFIFLENVPAITSRGGLRVVREITEMGYDCRWCVISAASIGAVHLRERWFCLARNNDSKHINDGKIEKVSNGEQIANTTGISENDSHARSNGGWPDTARDELSTESEELQRKNGETCANNAKTLCANMANTMRERCENREKGKSSEIAQEPTMREDRDRERIRLWQETVSSMDRTTNGVPFRVDRVRALGNAVVPEQAKEAFKILMGYK